MAKESTAKTVSTPQSFIVKSSVYFGICGLLALALAGCTPSNSGNNAAQENSSVANEATLNSAIIPSASSTPTATARASLVSSIWVPGKDDKLHLKPLSPAVLDSQKKFGDPRAALAEIVRMAPQFFPPKTQVLDFHDDGKTVSVNLNRNFEDAKFWSQAGDTTVRLAVYALVNTAATATGTTKPVILQTEKRAISTLGELDVSDGLEPDTQLQAKAGASSSKTSASGGKEGGA